MKKYLPIYTYGILIIFGGIFLLFSESATFNMVKYSLGITLTSGAIFAFIAAFTRGRNQVAFAYHEIHALTMLVYGVSILLLCNTYERIILATSFLFIFYTFTEIILSNWLFNLAQKVIYKILIIRVLLGLAVGISTVIALQSETTFEVFGIMFVIIGINIILYVPVMKGTQIADSSIPLNQ